MYRTEKILKRMRESTWEYPVCIPSYGRPDSAFTRWLKSGKCNIPKANLYMFIRNTEEQKDLYRPLRKYVNLVLLPSWVTDLGSTRKAIILWGQKHEHELLFMFDDRVDGVWWLSDVDRNGQTFLDVDKRSTPRDALRVWAYEHIHNGMLLSGASSKGFHWLPRYVGEKIEPINGGTPCVAVAVSPMEWKRAGINYSSIEEDGAEDIQIVYKLLQKREPLCMIRDICYSQAKPEATGGNAKVHPGMSRIERMDRVLKIFWENMLGLSWDPERERDTPALWSRETGMEATMSS